VYSVNRIQYIEVLQVYLYTKYKLQNQTVYRHLSTPPTDHILLHHRPPTAVTVILFVLSGFSFSFRFVLPCLSILFGSLGTFRGFP
jgi:hypothetical protein